MRKIFLISSIHLITILSFAFSNGREICTTTGKVTSCEIEGLNMEVSLIVPKSIYIEKEDKLYDFDFGDVIKGEDAEARGIFKLKGDLDRFERLEIKQNNSVVKEFIQLTNEKNSSSKVNVKVLNIQVGPIVGEEIAVEMKLKVQGEETVNLESGEYNGVFTVRAILK